jgi:glycosyltransferase involved in cell wall biosynthesis
MRITIVYRYFHPDTPPYAAMLAEMTRWFAEAGHEVEVITAQPSYKPEVVLPRQPWSEERGGVRIRRLPVLPENRRRWIWAINSAVFVAMASAMILFGRRRDLLWTATMPPVFQAALIELTGRVRGAGLVYHMLDIHPELGIVAKVIRPGLLTRMMRWLDVRTINRAAAVVVLSADMERAIEMRGARPRRLEVINNFSLQVCDPARGGRSTVRSPGAGSHEGSPSPIRFVFAGNIGEFQNLEALVAAFSGTAAGGAVLELVGDGRAKAGLEAVVRAGGTGNVRFHRHMPIEEAFEFIRACDIGVVSLVPGIYRFAFPSKILTYLAAGLPILAMVEPDSEMARMLTETGLGRAVGWDGEPDRIAGVIADMVAAARSGRPAPVAPPELFHQDRARARWLELLADLESDRKGA